MDDQNGKKAACWKKTHTLSPTFHDVLSKIEELRVVLEEEQNILRESLEESCTADASGEDTVVGVGTVTDG